MQKMTGQTADVAAENAAKIRELFPNCVDAQGNINFPALKTTLGVPVDSDKDSAANYSFVWSGKEKGRAYALAPSAGTLRPDRSKSVDFDTTKNLYIEGDNLEVLKLLRGSYAGRVKMIYIDPPYNTGNDFVYNDDYSDSIESYKKLVGIVADDGTKLKTNADTAGRYHTNWLNMMFPRLLLARDLLSDDGAIFISIDDHEVANLRKICDEVFGEDNVVAEIPWQGRASIQNDTDISVNHEYILAYAKIRRKENRRLKEENATEWHRHDSFVCKPLPLDPEKFDNPDNDPRGPWKADPFDAPHVRPNLTYPITNPNTGEQHLPPRGRHWRTEPARFASALADGRIYWGVNGTGRPSLKVFYEEKKEFGSIDNTWFSADRIGTATDGTKEVMKLFDGESLFDTPKPISLIRKLLYLANLENDSIVMDFFSGSATTAHAVMQMNAEDKGHRRFIMVQLQEKCPDNSEAAKAGYKNISEIGEERIRRAAAKIKAEHPDFKGDLGFKVFTLDSSNVIPWNPDPSKLDLTMRDMEKNLVAGRENEDLLFEILLKKNVPLDVDIESFEVETEENGAKTKNTIYVAGGVLFVCLDQHIPGEVSSEILKLRDELAPETDIQVVFRETGFCDVDKTNALAILEQGGVDGGQIWTL